jgi:hypothetical protein
MKKNIFSTILCLIFCLTAKAQEREAPNYNKFIGGYLSIAAGKGASPTYYFYDSFLLSGVDNGYSVYLSPIIGKQLNSKTMFGLNPFVAISKGTRPSNTQKITSKIQEYGLGFFSRHKIKEFGKFNFFLEPNINFRVGHYVRNNSILTDSYETTYKQLEMKVSPVLSYNLSPRFRFLSRLGGIRYHYQKSDDKDNQLFLLNQENQSYFNLDFGIRSITFGAEFLF